MTHTFNKAYWEEHWEQRPAGGMLAPNPHTVQATRGLTPGTALDVGCGTGTEAVWLAERGWWVAGIDISATALATAREFGATAGVEERVQWIEADASTWTPEQRFDLVTTHYAHAPIPQLEFYARMAAWVAPGGTLILVGHLHGHGGGHAHDDGAHGGHQHGHGAAEELDPPEEATVTLEQMQAVLDPAEWDVVEAFATTREAMLPGGEVRALHDVVATARRRPDPTAPADVSH
ncbi:class I SAM-dependent methyltransferase [Zhihengliuella flava]|uniref:SAM-dependent methyltransferase n=1 Tax=Zhihengliuella flava TaxID=1285193 RepID=A0A931GL36_9MICC|nr:class I SAM-dependent methyltransferase [Zhihengliuella flava]MBG6084094.1 SAM-dependent methyltransferase [Zhihengliuella flava]